MADEAVQGKLEGAPAGEGESPRDKALRAVQVALLKELDTSINKLERARLGESTREHLEILRVLLKAQVERLPRALRRAQRDAVSTTSIMYDDEVGAPASLTTTLRGLIEGGTLTPARRPSWPAHRRPPHAARLRRPRDRQVDAAERALRARLGRRALRLDRARPRPAGAQGALVLRAPHGRRRHRHRVAVRQGAAHAARTASSSARSTARRCATSSPCSRRCRRSAASPPCAPTPSTRRSPAIVRRASATATRRRDAPSLAAVRPVFVHMHSRREGAPAAGRALERRRLAGDELELEEVRTTAPAASQLVAEA